METITKTEMIGSAVPRLEAKGTTPADKSVSKSEHINFCAHRGHGCMNQQGYRCTISGPCQPTDANGRRFVVYEWIDNGQRLATRTYLDDVNGTPLKGPVAPIVCADTRQAAEEMRVRGAV